MKKVCHLSSVHSPLDPRIFYKECSSLAKAGYSVSLVIPTDHNYVENAVRVVAVKPPQGGRLERISVTVWRVFLSAWSQRADVYHFHDPELIPVGLLLRLRGAKVIYDVHEDFSTDLTQKPYLPLWIGRTLGVCLGRLEMLVAQFFSVVLAERYYSERFPKAVQVCNYPLNTRFSTSFKKEMQPADTVRLLYTGNVGPDRGSVQHAILAACIGRQYPNSEVTLVGRCQADVAQDVSAIAGESLKLVGVGRHVPYAEILEHYQSQVWTAGLAIFPATEHYVRKELTKLFEYMAAGLPIICSNFDVWRALVEQNGVGLCVDPEDVAEQIDAVNYLVSHPAEAQAMGQRGQELVSKLYNWERESQKLLALYQELVGEAA